MIYTKKKSREDSVCFVHFVIEEGPIKKWIGVQAEKNTDLEILKVVATYYWRIPSQVIVWHANTFF